MAITLPTIIRMDTMAMGQVGVLVLAGIHGTGISILVGTFIILIVITGIHTIAIVTMVGTDITTIITQGIMTDIMVFPAIEA